jgi:AraC-like DNA-binding protein
VAIPVGSSLCLLKCRGSVGDINMTRNAASEWRKRYATYGTELDFRPEANSRFFSSIYPVCNSPRVVRTTLSPGLVVRDRRMLRDGNDNINLAVSFEHDFNLSQRGREICLGRNEAVVMHADVPGTAGTRRQFKVLEVSISQQEWRLRSDHQPDPLKNVINFRSEGLKLLVGYLGVLRKSGLLSAPKTREAVHAHLIDLTVLTATQSSLGESHASCVLAARRAAALEYITSHFQDPALSVSRIAQDLGISRRYLQRLFEGTGPSLTEHVNELRLERAFALLACGDDRRVSDIALEVGFSDVGYFNRLFRSRFGDTPLGVRGSTKPPQVS